MLCLYIVPQFVPLYFRKALAKMKHQTKMTYSQKIKDYTYEIVWLIHPKVVHPKHRKTLAKDETPKNSILSNKDMLNLSNQTS